MKIKALALSSIITIGSLLASGCATDTASTQGGAALTLTTSLSASNISGTVKSGTQVLGANEFADSIHITSARLLFSNLKLHNDNEDTLGEKGTIKVGPFVAVFDSAGARVVTNTTIPAGTYDKIKFELHKLDKKLDDQYRNDSLIGPFITNDRNTVIVTGTVFKDGTGYPFTFASDRTENFEVKFAENLVLTKGGAVNVTMQFDPTVVFKVQSLQVYDPRDPDNHNKIEQLIHEGFKLIKKSLK